MKLSDNLKAENLRQIEYQESWDTKQHDIISKREKREFNITMFVLIPIIIIALTGIYFLTENQTVVGASLITGGLGALLGFLGGMGISKKTH